MIVWWNHRTGYLDEEMCHLLRSAVEECARGVRRFKIGQTCNPDGRARGQDYVGTYDNMTVIYSTTSVAYVDDAERHLIDCFPNADNSRGGGGGSKGEPPYYVYVVTTETSLFPATTRGEPLSGTPAMIACPVCASVVPGPNFCGMCGVSFASVRTSGSCGSCGAELAAGVHFCGACGAQNARAG